LNHKKNQKAHKYTTFQSNKESGAKPTGREVLTAMKDDDLLTNQDQLSSLIQETTLSKYQNFSPKVADKNPQFIDST
jgi:hypothetical protein